MKNQHSHPTEASFGFDVAIHRADDLDRLMIGDISRMKRPVILDLGCGAGGQSVRLAQAGARVTAIDIVDYSSQFAEHQQLFQLEESALTYIQGNIADFTLLTIGKTFDACCLQRTLHYLAYDDALELLTSLKKPLEGRLYVSVTGLDSEIGSRYADKQKPIESRFCRLEADAARTFFITEPICLYTKAEFTELLIAAGWSVEKVWTSAFGNVKAICQ